MAKYEEEKGHHLQKNIENNNVVQMRGEPKRVVDKAELTKIKKTSGGYKQKMEQAEASH